MKGGNWHPPDLAGLARMNGSPGAHRGLFRQNRRDETKRRANETIFLFSRSDGETGLGY
jgi:hypothetical protein